MGKINVQIRASENGLYSPLRDTSNFGWVNKNLDVHRKGVYYFVSANTCITEQKSLVHKH